MRGYQIPSLLLFLALAASLRAQEFKAPSDAKPLTAEEKIAELFKDAINTTPKGPGFDRTRGQIVFQAENGEYTKGEHFGRWNWPEFTPARWGKYNVELAYVSLTPKMGVQFFVGESKSKGYIPQSGGMNEEHVTEISRIYVPDTKPKMPGLLTGEDSSGPSFRLHRIILTPGPEGDLAAQAIDGHIELQASQATTFSEKMRYEPKPEKNCLGYWTEVEDWAEWNFSVHEAGKFEMEVFYGCGTGNEGSEMGVWFDQHEMSFSVKDTGGFQNWDSVSLGTIEVGEGYHIVTIKPRSKTNKAVADIQKVVLKPLGKSSSQ